MKLADNYRSSDDILNRFNTINVLTYAFYILRVLVTTTTIIGTINIPHTTIIKIIVLPKIV